MALGAQKVVFITTTGTGTFIVPSDFGSLVSVEAIGGGGGANTTISGGTGGGAYSKSTTVAGLYPRYTTYYQVGIGGTSGAGGQAGGDSWFNAVSNAAPTLSTQGVLAKGGSTNTNDAAAALGGQSASCIGTLTYSGGNGGNSSGGTYANCGGGGAAGPNGAGGSGGLGLAVTGGGGGGGANGGTNGTNCVSGSTGGSGGTGGSVSGSSGGGSSGTGATSSTVAVAGGIGAGGGGGGGGFGGTNKVSGSGGAGNIWTQTSNGATAGPGGGSGGSTDGFSATGGSGGLYGGGAGNLASGGGNGAQGIIVFTYLPNIQSGFKKADDVFGTIDLDDQYVTDSWLVDKYVGGTLFAWGENGSGQLGNGNITYYSSPVQVGNLNNWKQISAGQTFSIAVKTDGTLWSWGNNQFGQLSQGNTTNYSSPVQVGALTTWKQVSAGFDAILGSPGQVAAITTSGALWMWGSNLVGQLGINATGNGARYYSSPVQVGTLTNWKQVSCEHNCAHVLSVKTDGTLWAWGANQYGQLGINTVGTKYYSSPVQVGTLTNWKQVSNGQWTSFAIKTDGTLWSWGYNASNGSLGLGFSGNSSYYSSPVQVGTLTNWKQVSSGLYYSSAIKTDGTLWAWGENVAGQFGNGNITSYSSPVQIGSLTNWKYVSSGYQHTLAIKTDGTLWTWGANQAGQLGYGNITFYSSPVQVGNLTNWKYAGAGVSFSSAITFTDLN